MAELINSEEYLQIEGPFVQLRKYPVFRCDFTKFLCLKYVYTECAMSYVTRFLAYVFIDTEILAEKL
jgi:hypothetical protein